MSKFVKSLPNQSLLDMVVAEYGTLEAGMVVAAANGVDISHVPLPGSLKAMPAIPTGFINPDNADYIRKNKVEIGTLALPELQFAIVLKPVMSVQPNAAGDPHALGYYSFDLKNEPGFIHINALIPGWLSDNKLVYETEERYIFAMPPELSAPTAVTPMPGTSIPYHLVWTTGFGYMMVWSDLSQPVVTPTFRDIEGNTAYFAPLTVLDNVTMETVIARLIGDVAVEMVSSSQAAITLRVTMSHPPIPLANFSDHSMEWLGDAIAGTPDPLDPSNPNKKILTLPAGTYTLGMRTTYYFPGGTPVYPRSAFTMVIKVS